MKDPIIASYLIETPHPVEFAAEMIAGEQSSGTFVAVPGETDELKARSRAQVVAIEPLDAVEQPSLPGCRPPRNAGSKPAYRRARVTVEFPYDNIGPNLPTLLATLCGNLFELSQLSGIKLLDVQFPAGFAQHYGGPKFGIAGTRKLAGVEKRPLIGTIIKPSVGLSAAQTAALVKTLAEAGIDFIKDDELQANSPYCPFKDRVTEVMRVINEVADRTGRKVMFAFNITDDYERMLRNQELVMRAGGTCVMASIHSVGFSAFAELRRRCDLPIHGHRNGWGLYTRHPFLGIDYVAWQKLWRLVGADQLHVNGLANKFWEPDDSVIRSIKACMTPMFRADDTALPVVSSGQWGGQAPDTLRATQTTDLLYLAGGGILAHPLGPAAGVLSLQQAWEAAIAGIPLGTYALEHPELRATLAKFGNS